MRGAACAGFLPDDDVARQWGLQVIRDLKKNSETSWKGWTINVTEGDRKVLQTPFIDAV
jgi:hypothetical protein